jgi:hypothetical protein
MAGFALSEYVVPHCGFSPRCTGGKMSKAAADAGGLFDVVKRGGKGPGPDAYHKDALARPFHTGAKGGTFSKLTRDHDGIVPKATKGPSPGQYEIQAAATVTTPRTRLGVLSKKPRGCVMYDIAVKESTWKQGPGKYEPKTTDAHQGVPHFNSSKGVKEFKAGTNLGPGHYTLNHVQCEKRVISHSSPKEASRSMLDKALKEKEKSPAPGHNGIPESKVEDLDGRRKHIAN